MSIPAAGGGDGRDSRDCLGTCTEGGKVDGSSSGSRPPVTAESLALSLAAAAAACALGGHLAASIGAASCGLAAMAVVASGFAVLGARLAARLGGSSGGGEFPPAAAPFAGAEALGGALMMSFFATIGAAAGSVQVLESCGWVVAFILLQLG